ncbi:ABC transporter ATP-binding protein [Leifsonia xyli subsp. cynodontis DSM 46306]|uniref:ABC transporter domain-containing protein n=1 Tax=Leifsonia xyli subsp. cynodontis DSM 46306 TaxID=1389489 RepID=U3PEB6_LEIXC|nr:ABC transporter ATP-binding protein [Leifsonia xyli]AGW41903.1 ABC transporter ATP-binding protein [Leifsonia xyli subsp. cynodontis DSM 46306]
MSGETAATSPLLSITGLEVAFGPLGRRVPAVTGADLEIFPGETVAIVGESGSGKSTTAHAVIGLLPEGGTVTGGRILFAGEDITHADARRLEALRGREIGFVPQDPMSNLNPVWSIGYQVGEAVRANGVAKGRRAVRERTIEVLGEAGLPDPAKRLKQYPHQFSGGMRQRALIGIGLAARPQLLIADEPTSALDVTVQRVILDHLATLTGELGTSVLLITHDLGLAAERADRVVVMYRGRVVEAGPSRELLQNPRHPYTRRLVAAAPSLASQRLRVTERPAAAPTTTEASAVEAFDVRKVYRLRTAGLRSEPFAAVDGVSLTVARGTTTALVGESGSGKSTMAKMVLGLEKPTEGRIDVDGQDIGTLDRRGLFALRRRMQPVFQDPYGSLDPLRSIHSTIAEPLAIHGIGTAAERRRRVGELLDQVTLPASFASRYPNELSGGQRQRVAIARALALNPEIVVLDEAVSALDVLVQAQVLELLVGLQEELGLTYLFITHDLAVVRTIADRVSVMRAGRVVEEGTTDEVFAAPREDYTRTLLEVILGAAIPLG